MAGPWERCRQPGTGVAVAVVLLAVAPSIGHAQVARPYVGLGYVASAPELFGGGAIYGVLPGLLGGLGLYIDAKFDLERPTENRGYEPDLTAEQVENEIGDEFFRSEGSWYNINAALMRPLNDRLVLYLGAGYASQKIYNRYHDEEQTGEYGFGNYYWVEDVAAARTVVNVLGGAFIRIADNINVQFGAERHPNGFTVGASYLLPL